MKIIEQGYEIISMPGNLLQVIEAAGRTCYKSEDKIGCNAPKDHPDWEVANGNCIAKERYMFGHVCNEKCEFHSSQKFAQRMRDRGHHAMIEFGDIIVRFVTNRGVTHELVRHRLCSFAQESTRYVRYGGNMEFIRPCWCKSSCEDFNGFGILPDDEDNWLMAIELSENKYLEQLEMGWRPEQAREVLPNSLKTEIVVKSNIREWRHIFNLRCSKKAHPQIRSLMLPLLDELQERVPVVFDDIYESIGKGSDHA